MRLLSAERRALSELSLTTSGLAKNSSARTTGDNSLSVRKDSGHLKAALATDIHEKAARSRDKLLQFMFLGLGSGGGVQDIDS